MAQELSDHHIIKAYLHRFNIFFPNCGCDSTSYQSWEHIIFNCALFEGNRSKLMRKFVIEGLGWPPSGDLLLRDKKYFKNILKIWTLRRFCWIEWGGNGERENLLS